MCAASPQTRSGLLIRLENPGDQEAWCEFVDLYGPLIHRWCRSRGLQEADAADVTQAVLLAVAAAMRRFRYDRTKGRFRSWLATFTRRQTFAHLAAAKRRRLNLRSSDGLDNLAASAEDSEPIWDEELANRRFRRAAGQARGEFRDRTWCAFWRSAIEGTRPADLARELGMSVGAVYIARCRVLARIKELAGQPAT